VSIWRLIAFARDGICAIKYKSVWHRTWSAG
jgi:hypothetical protein